MAPSSPPGALIRAAAVLAAAVSGSFTRISRSKSRAPRGLPISSSVRAILSRDRAASSRSSHSTASARRRRGRSLGGRGTGGWPEERSTPRRRVLRSGQVGRGRGRRCRQRLQELVDLPLSPVGELGEGHGRLEGLALVGPDDVMEIQARDRRGDTGPSRGIPRAGACATPTHRPGWRTSGYRPARSGRSRGSWRRWSAPAPCRA